jgi:hypothetical protein
MKKSGASQGSRHRAYLKESPTSGTGAGKPQQNAPAHQESRLGRRRWKWMGTPIWSRRHHLHWRILQECREAYLRQGRVSEIRPVSSTRVSTETYAARSTSTKEKKLTSPPRFKALVRQAVALTVLRQAETFEESRGDWGASALCVRRKCPPW